MNSPMRGVRRLAHPAEVARARLFLVLGVGLVLALAIGAFVVLSGGSDDDEADDLPTVLVGEVDGGKALIAVVRSDEGVTVYSCGLDENLKTHTGWFFGAPEREGSAQRIPTLRSAGGLELEGQVDGDRASGTLKLASGDVVEWDAEPAEGGAGLYQNQDTLAFTGLIVANDGRTAGNANLATTTTLEGTNTTTNTVAVSVTTPPTTSTESVPVSFPVNTTTVNVPLDPVTQPGTKTIVKTGPTIVFLAHGMSDSTGTPDATGPQDLAKCVGPRNRPFYSRCEWGVDFVPGLFGLNPGRPLFNLAGRDVTGTRYLTDVLTTETPIQGTRVAGRPVGDVLFDENIGIRARDANGCVTDQTAPPVFDAKAAQHFVTATAPVKGVPPPLSVFTTWRDSTRGVIETGERLAIQAYAALKWFEGEYKVAPRLVFLSQSFGGIGTRFLLSNPPRDVYDRPALNPDRIVICPEDRAKMDYLRDRTSHAVTLATPHEGSYMAEWGEPPKDVLRAALQDLRAGLNNTLLARVLRAIDAAAPTVIPRPPNVVQSAQRAIVDLLKLLDTPALRDLKLATMLAFNQGPLSPERARRTRASPIVGAADTLIPMYATLGRSPGSTSFNSPDVIAGWATRETETQKEKDWLLSTMLFSDVFVKQFIPNGFGRVDVAPYAPFANLLDRRARLFDLSDQNTAAEQFVSQAASSLINRLAPYFTGRFGPGVDGVIDFLSTAPIPVLLPNAVVPIHVDRVWRLGLSGSVEVPMLAFSCGAERIVVDYDPLVRALLIGFDSTEDLIAAATGDNPAQVFDVARQAAANGAALLEDTVEWFMGEVQGLGELSEDCRLPVSGEDLVTDFLSLGNLVNWRMGRVTGTVPAPAWERTATVARDREMDTDGPVHSASALGFTLGRVPFFFEHNRDDGPVVNGQRTIGSWYRIHDNPVTEKYNHGLQYANDVGRWVRQRLLAANVGPIPQRNTDSTWPS